MGKIITVTLNPAIDQIMEVNNFKVGQTTSVKKSYSYPAGKGVNVARALACLNHQVITIGIIDEKNKEFFDTIANSYLTTDWVTSETPTRTNVTIYDGVNNTETHLRNQIASNELFPTTAIVNKLQTHCTREDIVVLSGSLPANATVNELNNLCKLCKDTGARVIVDSSSIALKLALETSPYMIKPNLTELRELTATALNSEEEIIACTCKLAEEHQIDVVTVSMGKDGAIMFDRKNGLLYKARVDMSGENITPHSVGSGDAMVAGFCSGLIKTNSTVKALQKGTAAGAANLLTEIPGWISQEEVDKLMDRVKMTNYRE